jgi:hypothetical protein
LDGSLGGNEMITSSSDPKQTAPTILKYFVSVLVVGVLGIVAFFVLDV